MENNTASTEITMNGGAVPSVNITEASPEKKTSGATTVSLPSTKSSTVVTNEPKRRVSIASDPVAVAYDNMAFEPSPKGRKISQVSCFTLFIMKGSLW